MNDKLLHYMDKSCKNNLEPISKVSIDYNGDEVITFRGLLENFSSKDLHSHKKNQLLLINSGVTILIDKKQRQPLYGMSVAFIPVNCEHRSIVIGDKIDFQTVLFDNQYFNNKNNEITIFNMSKLGISLFDRIIETREPDIINRKIEKCFDLFFHVINEDIENEASLVRLPEAKNEYNIEIINYIQNNYTNKIEIKDFAFVPFSVRHISRLFRNDLKITIFEYIRLYRILMATVLLTNNNSILDSVYSSGYNSPSLFYKDFKKYLGISPKVFKDKLYRKL